MLGTKEKNTLKAKRKEGRKGGRKGGKERGKDEKEKRERLKSNRRDIRTRAQIMIF